MTTLLQPICGTQRAEYYLRSPAISSNQANRAQHWFTDEIQCLVRTRGWPNFLRDDCVAFFGGMTAWSRVLWSVTARSAHLSTVRDCMGTENNRPAVYVLLTATSHRVACHLNTECTTLYTTEMHHIPCCGKGGMTTSNPCLLHVVVSLDCLSRPCKTMR